MTRRLLVNLVALMASCPSWAGAATLSGQVYTADHPESLASAASVTLIYRVGGADPLRVDTTTDGAGRFVFRDLDADTSIAYVLRIDAESRRFLSAPIRYAPGEEEIDFNVLLSGESTETGLPTGHPPIDGPTPQGRPVKPSAAHTILLVIAVVSIYLFLALRARPRGA